ncbi:FAD-dependent oxidoreductase [Devosia sp.]|uniref:FAD-dependent oxidoreductase n=1 Tax=Devosia sp. TaxID=1871048 RepID=UPI002AFEA897|nr:FAD-dependent oxidoreductase [Devosia sp.]
MAEQFDAIVIGAGEAGVAHAARMAAFGKRVALIEAGPPGEAWLEEARIATRALAESARAIWTARHAGRFGVTLAGPVGLDMRAVRNRKTRLVQGAGGALAERLGGLKHLTRLQGQARFVAPDGIMVGKRLFGAPEILLDIGTRPRMPNWPGLDSVSHLTPATISALDSLPGHLIVVGASAAGLEFAQIQARFGAKVSVIEAGPHPLAGEDEEVCALMRAALEADGVSFLFNTTVDAVDWAGHGVLASLRSGRRLSSIEGTHLLLAPEPVPMAEGLDLAAAGITVDQAGFVIIDPEGHTGADGVRALGPGTMGGAFACNRVMTDPAFIRLGMTTAQLRRAGRPLKVAMRKDGEKDQPVECIRLLADAGTGALLGASLLGPEAAVLAAALRPFILSGAAPDPAALLLPARLEARLSRAMAGFSPLK